MLVLISGLSASGKNTIIQNLKNQDSNSKTSQSTSEGGRPEKANDEKSEKTIQNRECQN